MDQVNTPPQAWLDSLARSDAQLAAGQVVSGEPARQRLREAIAEMEDLAAIGVEAPQRR